MTKQKINESVRKCKCEKLKMRRLMAILLCFTISFSLMQPTILFANSKKDNVKLQMMSASSADTNFLLYSYMANYYLNTGKIVDASESMFLDISPSRLLYKEGQKEGTDQAAKLWKQFMNVVGAVDKPSSVVDAVLEKKNIYSGLLFSICQCSYDKYTINKLDTTMAKNANTVYSLLKEGMITEYSIDFANSVSISKLSEDEKKFLSELTNEIVEDDFGTTGEVMEALGDELEVIGGINTIGDWCNYVANCIALNEINEGTKQIIREMYEICPDSNASLKGALYDCLDIINANELDMIAHLSTYVGGQMTKDAAQDLVDTYYGNLKNAAIANNPYIGLIWLAYKGSKLLTNTVFNSDDISEKYCKLEAILDIRDLAYQVYLTEKANFEGDDSEQNAQVLMASINFMFQSMQEDCNCAQSYVETIDKTFCEKVKSAFGCSNTSELIRQIKSRKSQISSVWRTATLEWIYELKDDFPAEYERYSYLLPKSVSLGKSKITIYVGQSKSIPFDSREILKWTSSKNSVVSVDENGKITGKKAGTSIITASVGDVSDTCTVTVKKSTIKLNKSKVTIKKGNSFALKAVVKGASNKVTWTTSDKTIATVSSTGKVTGKKAGTVTITATANGVSAKCKITVNKTKDEIKNNNITSFKKYYSDVLKKKYGTFNSEQTGIMKSYSDRWLKLGGVMGAAVQDLDGDGKDELFVCISKNHSSQDISQIFIQVYEKKENNITLASEFEVTPYISGKEDNSNGGMTLSVSNWAEQALIVSLVIKGDNRYIVCEQRQTWGAFADGRELDYWILKYKNNKLDYVNSYTQTNGGSSGFEYTCYQLRNGKVVSEQLFYSEEYENVKPKYSKYDVALNQYFKLVGIKTIGNIEQNENILNKSIIAKSENRIELFRFNNKLLSGDYVNSVFKYKATTKSLGNLK